MNCFILMPRFNEFGKLKSTLAVDSIEYLSVPSTFKPWWKWPKQKTLLPKNNGELIPINRTAQLYLESIDEDWMFSFL